jgi:DNA-directed RNA polymerase specialized sigma24 family protein
LEEALKEVLEANEEKLSNEEKELLLEYTNKFIKDNLMNITHYCYQWNGTNGIRFKIVLPEDLVFKVLGLINEGRRIFYSKSYRHFKGSVYYHVKNELLTFFNCRKKTDLTEDSPESLFILNDAENYFEEDAYAYDAEDILGKMENNELREAMLSLFDPNDDIDEILVLEEILNNKKREEISEALKITVDEVTNIRKRINRKIEKNINKNLLEGII